MLWWGASDESPMLAFDCNSAGARWRPGGVPVKWVVRVQSLSIVSCGAKSDRATIQKNNYFPAILTYSTNRRSVGSEFVIDWEFPAG